MTNTDRRSIWHSLLEVEAILALGSLIIFGVALGIVLFDVVPAENEKYVMLMLGALIGVVKDTFGRYFQATKGSQEQRKEAAEVARTLAETAAITVANAPTPVVVEAPAKVTVDPAPDPDEIPTDKRLKP